MTTDEVAGVTVMLASVVLVGWRSWRSRDNTWYLFRLLAQPRRLAEFVGFAWRRRHANSIAGPVDYKLGMIRALRVVSGICGLSTTLALFVYGPHPLFALVTLAASALLLRPVIHKSGIIQAGGVLALGIFMNDTLVLLFLGSVAIGVLLFRLRILPWK